MYKEHQPFIGHKSELREQSAMPTPEAKIVDTIYRFFKEEGERGEASFLNPLNGKPVRVSFGVMSEGKKGVFRARLRTEQKDKQIG